MIATSDIEQSLRDLLARWDTVESPKELLALGDAALRRLLDSEGKGDLRRTDVDPRDYGIAEGAAIAAFARDDLDGVLKEMRKRGWDGPRIARSGVGVVRDPRVVSALLELCASDFPGDRANAMWALGIQGDSRATKALVGALSDQTSHVRSAAIDALGEAGDPTAIQPLREFARCTREAWLARKARSTIAKIQKTVRSSKKKG